MLLGLLGNCSPLFTSALPRLKNNMHCFQDWYSPDIEVLIRDTHEDSGLIGQIGVVRGVTPGMCSVFLPDEDRTVNIPAEHLQPVQPVRGDRVKVIMGKLKVFLTWWKGCCGVWFDYKCLLILSTGEDRDLCGTLLSIDSQEGVVKLEPSGDVKMLQLKYLSKMKSD